MNKNNSVAQIILQNKKKKVCGTLKQKIYEYKIKKNSLEPFPPYPLYLQTF